MPSLVFHATFLHRNAGFSSFLGSLSPDATLLLMTLGVLLIFLELNRPGSILPGVTGLLCVLLAVAALAKAPLQLWAVGLLCLAVTLLAANLWKELPAFLLATATLMIAVGFHSLVAPERGSGEKVSLWVATSCGGIIGGAAAVLSRIALRARRAKAVH